ncbi:MAG TPA: SigE family RNA polymerase sigma factor [Nocardioidaceae bacterium]|nr:SigE family RNA polymerase sigma factor [Nocardioidaceae bacterium]
MKDAQFLSEVYAASYRRLVTGMCALCGDKGAAEEIVQEAFVRALAARTDFRRVDNPEAWLRRVAINIHHSRWRRMQKLASLYRKGARAAEVASQIPETDTDHVMLVEALRRLPTSQREAIALHHFMDLSVSETAATLGVPEGTVKARLARGRAALAERLQDIEEVRHAQR